jgi:hypothetical protein
MIRYIKQVRRYSSTDSTYKKSFTKYWLRKFYLENPELNPHKQEKRQEKEIKNKKEKK